MKYSRLVYFACFLVVTALLGFTFFLEYAQSYEPCPLCIIQRLLMIGLGIVFLVALLHNPKHYGKAVYGTCTFLISIGGLLVASRQVYLQNLPLDKTPACGAGLNYLVESLPITEVIKQIFIGTADCALVQWEFLGISMAGWSLIWFSIFLFVALLLILLRGVH